MAMSGLCTFRGHNLLKWNVCGKHACNDVAGRSRRKQIRFAIITGKTRLGEFGCKMLARVFHSCGEEGIYKAYMGFGHSVYPGEDFSEALSADKQTASSGCSRDRRSAIICLFLTMSQSFQHIHTAMAADEETKAPLDLESYVDETEGFTVLKPAQWKKIDKAGATVLFEDPLSKGNNVGVVVNPVRISSLRDFGTADVVADRLLQAERKKPSTNSVQLIKVNERQAQGGALLYQLEYLLDSSRGFKRILSAVTVASKKLYILNVAYVDGPEKPLRSDTAAVLEQIVNSFDLLN